ncbi:hypothetical protein [Enterovibrio norvegicus]|uniref:hypothetical protein n=1 Tax=Enterovibrio norvegicus TaxID=188144 RepID=UPI00352DC1C3
MTENEQNILNDPSISVWLKQQIQASYERDILDVLNDLEQLQCIMTERLEALLSENARPSEIKGA